MKRNDDSDFRAFLAFKFATEEKQWEPWMNFIAKDYYLSFLESNDILLKLISPYLKRKKAELSKKESCKVDIILNLYSLFKSIIYDAKTKTVSIKSKKLDSFNEVTSEEKLSLIKESKEDLINDISKLTIEDQEKNLDSFKLLVKKSSLFINFYKNSKIREDFFQKVIAKNDLQTINSPMPVFNKNIQNYAMH